MSRHVESLHNAEDINPTAKQLSMKEWPLWVNILQGDADWREQVLAVVFEHSVSMSIKHDAAFVVKDDSSLAAYFELHDCSNMPSWFDKYRHGIYNQPALVKIPHHMLVDLRFAELMSRVMALENKAMATYPSISSSLWFYMENLTCFAEDVEKVLDTCLSTVTAKCIAEERPVLCVATTPEVESACVRNGFTQAVREHVDFESVTAAAPVFQNPDAAPLRPIDLHIALYVFIPQHHS